MPVTADMDLDFAIVILPDEPLADLIVEQLEAARPGRELVLKSNLAEAAAAHGERPLLLVLADPVEALARCLQRAGSAGAALAAWKSEIAPLLTAARRLRRRIWLVDARAVASGDAATLALIAPGSLAQVRGDVPALPDAIYMVLAEALLARDAEAGRFAGEIAALRRGAGAALVDMTLCEDALARYADLTQETALLRDHIALHAATTLREAADTNAQAEAAEQARLSAELAKLEEIVADRNLQKAKAEALQRKLDDIQAKAVQREFVLSGILLADQAADRTEQERIRADGLEHELHRVYGSRSWRITRPLRAVRSGRKG
ncbi:hypothetical protein [Pseudotabrizicola sp. 4114]|uniref:hypothetical protein n=1 Tax=Pseudotabrizicola sp. 4114 TaxID=2817731 RepID=UPI002858ED19|nr:hypothetical protein [Pseudorhodobacter sp. 4114]